MAFSLGTLGSDLGAFANAEIEDLEGLSDTELIGVLAALEGLGAADPATRKVAARAKGKATAAIARKNGKKGAMAVPRTNNVGGETTDLTAKALFENRLSQVDPGVVEKLKKGLLQICDYAFYSVRPVVGTNVKMFEDGIQTGIGATNVVQGRVYPEDYFLATGLRVMTAVSENQLTAKFGLACPEVLNGEFKLGQESTVYMEKTSSNIFNTDGRMDIAVGYHKLEAPKMFYPQRTLRWDFDLPAVPAANTLIRVDILGVRTMKA